MNRSLIRTVLASLIVASGVVAADADASVLVRRDASVPDSVMGEGVIAPDDGVRISVSGDGGANFINVGVGLFSLQSAPSSDPAAFSNLLTFCLEINEALTWHEPVHVYEIGAIGTGPADPRPDLIARLWSDFSSALLEVPPARGELLAAFQSVIWEIMEDGNGTLDVETGNFRVECATAGNVCTLAEAFIDGLGTATPVEGLVRLASDTQQDLISFRSDPGGGGFVDPSAEVPAPATLLVLGGALAGLGVLRRRS